MDQKKKAVIYCRVSTKEQVEEGNSLHTQEKICREYAVKYDYEICRVFIELGESAKTADRTELKKLLAFCMNKKERINAVIIYRIDRLSRQMEDYTFIRSKLKQNNIEIKSTAEYFEDNPSGRFMENIIANVAQFDNDVRTERCVNGMKDAIREGRYVWSAPFGYSNGRINGKPNLVPNQYAHIIREAFELLAKDQMPVEHARLQLTNKWIKKGNIRLPGKSQFPKILQNEIYAGWICKFEERHKGLFEPIISESLFLKVQWVLKDRRLTKKGYLKHNPDFPLRKFFIHPSGLRLTGAWCKGNKKKYAYYFYRLPLHIYPKALVEQAFLKLLDTYTLPAPHFKKLSAAIQKSLIDNTEDRTTVRLKYIQQIDILKHKERVLIQKNVDGILPDLLLKEHLDILAKEIYTITDIIQQSPETVINYDRVLGDVREFVEHPSETWKKANYKGKIMLQWLFFPKGVFFDGTNCRTPETCNVFRLKDIFSPYNSGVVNYPDSKINTTDATVSPPYIFENIKKELILLSETKKKMESDEILSDENLLEKYLSEKQITKRKNYPRKKSHDYRLS